MMTSKWFYSPRSLSLLLLFFISSFTSVQLQAQGVKLGFMLSSLNTDRWYKDKAAFNEKATALGGTVIITNAEDDASKQLLQVDELIQQGVKVLVVIPVDGLSAAGIVEKAHKANIKVIAYDRLIKNCDLDFYVSYNNKMVGEIMAKYALQEKPSGKYTIINGPESDNNTKLVNQGIHAVLDASIQSGKINLLEEKTTEQWSEMEATMITQDLIQKHKGIDVIITGADVLAVGTVHALEEDGLAGKILVTGQDADLQSCKYMMEGKQQMTILKPIGPLAAKAAELAMQIAQGTPNEKNGDCDNGKITVPSFLIEPTLVTRENLKSLVILSGFWKESDLEK